MHCTNICFGPATQEWSLVAALAMITLRSKDILEKWILSITETG